MDSILDVGISVVLVVPAVLPDVSSLGSHNPTRDDIAPHVCPCDKLSDAAKFTAAAKQKLNKENATELKLKVSENFNGCRLEIDRLAKKYNRLVSHIKQLLNNESNYKN